MLPLVSLLVHFGCVGDNCRWPFLRHPHELDHHAIAAQGGISTMLHYISAALPQNDVSVAAPFFFYYAALPALLPKEFPVALPSQRLPSYPLRFRRGFMHLSGQHHKSATHRTNDPIITRGFWIALFIVILSLCGYTSISSTNEPAKASNAAAMTDLPAQHLRVLIDRALYHSKRAYGCNATIYPPRSISIRKDASQPCGEGGRDSGWSASGMGLDIAGTTISSLAFVGLAASVPRRTSSWTYVGSNTLSVYLLHIYVLPAIDMPLAALAQAASYFLHPEAAAPTALLGCLLVVRALALPLPTRHMFNLASRCLRAIRSCRSSTPDSQ